MAVSDLVSFANFVPSYSPFTLPLTHLILFWPVVTTCSSLKMRRSYHAAFQKSDDATTVCQLQGRARMGECMLSRAGGNRAALTVFPTTLLCLSSLAPFRRSNRFPKSKIFIIGIVKAKDLCRAWASRHPQLAQVYFLPSVQVPHPVSHLEHRLQQYPRTTDSANRKVCLTCSASRRRLSRLVLCPIRAKKICSAHKIDSVLRLVCPLLVVPTCHVRVPSPIRMVGQRRC